MVPPGGGYQEEAAGPPASDDRTDRLLPDAISELVESPLCLGADVSAAVSVVVGEEALPTRGVVGEFAD